MDPLTKNLLFRSGLTPAHTRLPPAHNVRLISLQKGLTGAEEDLHAARVALKTFEAAGAGGDIDDVYTAMQKLQGREEEYFARRYLERNKTILKGWKALSKYKKNGKVGAGFQGIVYHVANHPNKVVKNYKIRHEYAHSFFLKTSLYDKIASENGFGPIIYEVSVNRHIVNMEEKNTIPVFKRGMVFSVMMEKIYEIENDSLLNEYIGIVQSWMKMRKHGIFNGDGFFGHSSTRQIVVSADFGGVSETENDDQFIEVFSDFIDLSHDFGQDFEGVATKYAQHFPTDEMPTNILIPALETVRSDRERTLTLSKKSKVQ